VLWLALAGCGEDTPVEGQLPGSCTDGFDNDANGVVDCEDPGCASSPDCACEAAEVPDYAGYAVTDDDGLPDYEPVDVDIDCNDNAVEVELGNGEQIQFTKFVWSWTDEGDEFNPEGAARMGGYTGNGQGCDETENLDAYDGWRMVISFDGKPDPGNAVDVHNAEGGAGGPPPPPKARAAIIRIADYRADAGPGTSAVDDTDPYFIVNSVTTGEEMTLLHFGAPLADGGEIRSTDLSACYCIALKDISD
jgi:hypothetical protein